MLKGYRCAVYTTRIYVVKPKKPGLPSVVSAAPQPGGTFTQLQGGGDRTRGWYRHHDLGVSLQLDMCASRRPGGGCLLRVASVAVTVPCCLPHFSLFASGAPTPQKKPPPKTREDGCG